MEVMETTYGSPLPAFVILHRNWMAAASTTNAFYDVVVIGNGPNAVCLSYILSGNWPYIAETKHPNPYLQQKLQNQPTNESLPLLKLEELDSLSEGLDDGRSDKPVGLLFDALLRPDADFDSQLPSCLEWRRNDVDAPARLSHLVIGDAAPGGSWNQYPADVRALSPTSWLELPGYSFSHWFATQRGEIEEASTERPLLKDIAGYYQDYVRHTGIADQFLNFATVVDICVRDNDATPSSLSEFPGFFHGGCPGCDEWADSYRMSDGDFADLLFYDATTNRDDDPNAPSSEFRFEIKINHDDDDVSKKIFAKNLVLATGMSGSPTKLGIEGEDFPFVYHKFQTKILSDCHTVMIVGSGLCAADSILVALNRGCRVVHVFRKECSDPSLIFNQIPLQSYPEYAQIFDLMRGKAKNSHYKCFECSHLVRISEEKRRCLVREEKTERDDVNVEVSAVFVLIGTSASLGFLPEAFRRIGVDATKPIDSRKNPIDVNPLTYQVRNLENLFAIGPLVGDNFVRFGIGGALGVATALVGQLQQREKLALPIV